MIFSKPRNLAIALAFIAVLFSGVMILIYSKKNQVEIQFSYLALYLILTFVLVYSAAYFLIKIFLQNKVRMIFRTIHDLKSANSKDKQIHMDSDVLGDINLEAQEWVREREEEIKGFEERELYRREFIGNLSHELKTPLFNIQGYILTLLEGGLEDKKVNREFLERAAGGVDRLTRIVEDMDMISKLESGVIDMKIEKIDLMKVIAEVVDDMRISAADAGLNIRVKKPLDKPIMVLADRDRISQIFTNLLNNSIKYGVQDGEVTIDIFEIEGQLWVEVEDNGIGIDPEHLPRLFERFYRVGQSRSRHEGGSGLGLAIVKQIIDSHKQTITVKSLKGSGTSFTFTLQKAK